MMDLWDSGISHCELLFYWYLTLSSNLVLIVGGLLGPILGKKREKKLVQLSVTELIAREIE